VPFSRGGSDQIPAPEIDPMRTATDLTAAASQTGLVLPGGGARAAYQVGVLKAIVRFLPKGAVCPFPVITGTSAGAINAVALACHADRLRAGVRALESVWANFRAEQVYRSDMPAMLRSSMHWIATLILGGLGRRNPSSLLNNRPLQRLLSDRIPLERIDRHLGSGVLKAVSVTASSYRSAKSVTFFQGRPGVQAWRRARREGRVARLGVEHLMASAAVPLIFPSVKIGAEYYGDGSMRQVMPLSPALHLGARRLLVIGVRDELTHAPIAGDLAVDEPSLGHLAGYILDTLFMDNLYSDLERLTRINQLVEKVPEGRLAGSLEGLHKAETLLILPSRDIRELALEYADELPRPVRLLLRGLGASGKGGGQLLSYLLFERGFTRALIRLGFEDAIARREHIMALLRGAPMPAIDAPAEVMGDLSGQQQSA
jgi:NTE family protein